jgi:hypothetical protein
VSDDYKTFVSFDIFWRVGISPEQLAELTSLSNAASKLWAEADDAQEKYLHRLREIVSPEVDKKLSAIGVLNPDGTQKLLPPCPACRWTPEIPGIAWAVPQPLVEIRATNKSNG